MRITWTGKNRLAKAAVVFATMFIVSLGLCGLTLVADFRITPVFGGSPKPGILTLLDRVFEVTCYIAMVGIGVALVGLIVVGVACIVRGIREP
jgi:hypothetical protein